MLVNHGLEKKYRALNNELELFFQLPIQEKMTFRIADEYGYGGYTPRGRESVSKTFLDPSKLSRPPDAVESLVLSDQNTKSLPSLKNGYKSDRLVKTYHALKEELSKLSLSVMELMAICLGLRRDFFFEFYEGKKNAMKDIRAARYFVEPPEKESSLPYGEHTDYTGFTFLWRSNENGLQCLDPTNNEYEIYAESKTTWLNVPILRGYEDAIVINAGDLIERWTNSYWISNVHRVIGQDRSDIGRSSFGAGPISIVHFTGPAGNTEINVLTESAKVRATGAIKDEWKTPITADEHLWMKLNASNG